MSERNTLQGDFDGVLAGDVVPWGAAGAGAGALAGATLPGAGAAGFAGAAAGAATTA